MALTGHLSDLSLSELIEFFCNQRKSGRLKVLYPKGAGYFYLQAGSVVDARIGVLQGIDAVYFALTLPNAQFEFSADVEAGSRTINNRGHRWCSRDCAGWMRTLRRVSRFLPIMFLNWMSLRVLPVSRVEHPRLRSRMR